MDTPNTIRAQELRDIYSTLSMKYLTQDERLDVLLTLKHTVKEHDCKLTQEIIELIDREADLLMRGVKESNLEGTFIMTALDYSPACCLKKNVIPASRSKDDASKTFFFFYPVYFSPYCTVSFIVFFSCGKLATVSFSLSFLAFKENRPSNRHFHSK